MGVFSLKWLQIPTCRDEAIAFKETRFAVSRCGCIARIVESYMSNGGKMRVTTETFYLVFYLDRGEIE